MRIAKSLDDIGKNIIPTKQVHLCTITQQCTGTTI